MFFPTHSAIKAFWKALAGFQTGMDTIQTRRRRKENAYNSTKTGVILKKKS